MRILITGGAGFIGSHLADYFQHKFEVVVLDNLITGKSSNLDGIRHRFVLGDINDPAAVAEAIRGVTIVFHLAAMVSVAESMNRPTECVESNSVGLLNLLEAASTEGAKKLVLASSAAIYGDSPQVPKVEHMLPEPMSPYAITKLGGEHFLEMYRREGRINSVSLRFFNVFGPRQDPLSAYAAAVPGFLRKALSGEPITIFGDGEQTRDFVYVRDVVAALVHVATRSELHGVYNVGYGRSTSINRLASDIIRLSGSTSRVEYRPGRPGDVRHSCASIDKLMSTGFSHVSSLETGLIETLSYFRSNSQ